jgi:PadR family transcriptional regulator, regulatory protein PadR
MTAHDSQMLKGALPLLLLQLLAERESYGYEVVQRLRAEGLTDIMEGTVYPAMTRLEKEGQLQSRLVPSSSGPARKYYRPTAAGDAALEAGKQAWAAQAKVVSAIIERPLPAQGQGTDKDGDHE